VFKKSKYSSKITYISKVLFIHQLTHYWVVLKNNIKIYIKTAPACFGVTVNTIIRELINPLNSEVNPICHLLALLGAHHILHVSRTRVNLCLLKLLLLNQDTRYECGKNNVYLLYRPNSYTFRFFTKPKSFRTRFIKKKM